MGVGSKDVPAAVIGPDMVAMEDSAAVGAIVPASPNPPMPMRPIGIPVAPTVGTIGETIGSRRYGDAVVMPGRIGGIGTQLIPQIGDAPLELPA